MNVGTVTPKQCGESVAFLAHILVTLKPGSEKTVLNRVSTFEEALEVDFLYGEYDALVKVSVESLSQLDTFLTEKLRVLPDVFQTATLIVAKQYKLQKK